MFDNLCSMLWILTIVASWWWQQFSYWTCRSKKRSIVQLDVDKACVWKDCCTENVYPVHKVFCSFRYIYCQDILSYEQSRTMFCSIPLGNAVSSMHLQLIIYCLSFPFRSTFHIKPSDRKFSVMQGGTTTATFWTTLKLGAARFRQMPLPIYHSTVPLTLRRFCLQ